MALRKFFGLCDHKWYLLEVIKVYDEDKEGQPPLYHKYVLQCEHCGKIKVKKT
jgi:hypothetical protein